MKTTPWAAVVVGVPAVALVLNRVLSGQWTMLTIVGIGVAGGIAALALWWVWDRGLFKAGLRAAAQHLPGALVSGGYLVEAGFRNVNGRRPPQAEIVLAADPGGLTLFDPRGSVEPVLAVRWADVIDVLPGEATLFGEQRRAMVVLTLEGRLVLVLRGDEKRGVFSAGDAAAGSFVGRVRELRGGIGRPTAGI
ncbi:MAG: hypothetical protein QM804_16740 [Propionicimonas sp.]